MDLQLEEKTAFISGSTAGIGYATARSLVREGAGVILNGRTQKNVDGAILKLLREFPDASISGLPADFGKSDEVDALLARLPRVDILINNVGIYGVGPFFEFSDADWSRQFEVNVMSAVRLSRHCLPKMMESDTGRIVFISSECATLSPPDSIAYNMTKTALISISKGLAQLTKGTQVTVNTIMPGSTLSEGAERFLEETAKKDGVSKQNVERDFFSKVRTSSLLQRFATVDEVAQTIAYMASPLASATNGAVIKVDGGSTGGIL